MTISNSHVVAGDVTDMDDKDEWVCDFCGGAHSYEVAHEDDSGREMTMNFCSGCNQNV